jgi:predicted nucleic acid-binding protein
MRVTAPALSFRMVTVVLDTNVLVAALLRGGGTGRAVLRACLRDLPDEADNHLIELAVAAQADAIVTRNLRDVARGELKFPMLRILTPEQCLEAFPCPP